MIEFKFVEGPPVEHVRIESPGPDGQRMRLILLPTSYDPSRVPDKCRDESPLQVRGPVAAGVPRIVQFGRPRKPVAPGKDRP